jgi:hypothetical protein
MSVAETVIKHPMILLLILQNEVPTPIMFTTYLLYESQMPHPNPDYTTCQLNEA